MGIMFFVNSILLGVGLAMDAFSVSLVSGLNEPNIKRSRMGAIAGTFAGFQGVMPLIGWFCVHTIAGLFTAFQKFIPWIAFVLLLFIGGKMLLDGLRPGTDGDDPQKSLSAGGLFLQGVATSIDALSVGFTIADYGFLMALTSALIISGVTLVICLAGIVIGKKFGTKLSDKATIFGGLILIGIGVEILLTGIFGG